MRHVAASETPYHLAEAAAVESFGGRYIDPTPWFCSKSCTPVIGNYDVYSDHWHLMGPYACTSQVCSRRRSSSRSAVTVGHRERPALTPSSTQECSSQKMGRS